MRSSQQSSEDYLESILMIREQKGYCRSIDVASHLGFSKPSVSVAMAKLRQEGYLEDKSPDGDLVLTEKGYAIASKIMERHKFFRDWLISLGVEEKTAVEDACGLEHMLSDESFRKIRDYICSLPVSDE